MSLKKTTTRRRYRELRAKESVRMNAPQPPPSHGRGEAVWNLVIRDMRERNRTGIRKYGQALRANDGRDSLVDLYQELLDAAVYIRKVIQERDSDPVFSEDHLSYSSDDGNCKNGPADNLDENPCPLQKLLESRRKNGK